MKRIYFVRHGMTEGNEAGAYQKLDIPLSEKGANQASFMAERFSKIKFDTLIASTMERAMETARAIGKKTDHVIIPEPLFWEVLKPTAVRGKLKTDPEVVKIMKAVNSYWTYETKRYSDEENFFDLKNRAVKALDYLISREEETMVVVTHGTFLRMMISVMMYGKDTQPDLFDKIVEFFYAENTGITWVEYDNKYHPKKWQLITWNDHAHLG